jgi:hypothetical protein
MPEQEVYTTPQSHVVTYEATPAKLQLVESSNVDVKVATKVWDFDVEAVDADGNIVELTPNGGAPVASAKISSTSAQLAQALQTLGYENGGLVLKHLQQALLKVAKAKL